MDTPEARCEKMSQNEIQHIVGVIKRQLQEDGKQPLPEGTGLPVTVLKFQNIPGMDALALIGYQPDKVQVIGVSRDKEKTVVEYTTEENKDGSSMKLEIGDMERPYGYYRTSTIHTDISMKKMSLKGSEKVAHGIHAFLTSREKESVRHGENIILNKCIVVSYSAAIRSQNRRLNYEPFVIVQDAQPFTKRRPH